LIHYQNGIYQLIEYIVAATTDNGAKYHCWYTSLLGFIQLPYFSHTLKPAVEQALKLPDISWLTGQLVAHFYRSTKSYACYIKNK